MKTKQKNRALSFLLVLAMLVSLMPVSVAAAGTKQGSQSSAVESGSKFREVTENAVITDPADARNIEENRPELANPGETEGNVTANQVETDISLHETLQQTGDAQLTERLETEVYADDEMVSVIVVLEDASLLDRGFSKAEIAARGAQVTAQTQALQSRQNYVTNAIETVVDRFGRENDMDAAMEVRYHYHIIISGMAVEVPYGALEQIRQVEGVKRAFVAPTYSLPETKDTVSPYTYATREEFGSVQTWQTGFSGEGMRIAIVDTGLDLDHPSFAAEPPLTQTSLTKEELAELLPQTNAYQAYSGVLGLSPETVYHSGKIPFAFNYADVNLDATHDHDNQGDHGTHVAGIAAANRMENTEAVGVAPDAQLIIMKVFGATAAGQFDDVLACLEDCFILNVDAVNMSLGTPAGFTSDTAEADAIFAKINESDMIASISAGNSTSAAYMNAWGTNLNMVGDIDNGIVSSPATYSGATMVASLENSTIASNYFSVGDQNVTYSDASTKPFTGLAGSSYTYVVIPNYGAEADYEGLDLTGKIALVSRGEFNFTDKQQYAYAAGAIACIVYDNVDGELINMQDSGLLPNVCITKADGEMMIAAAVNGEGTLTVYGLDEMIFRPSYYAGQISEFSSWGVTADLQLMPDVTAPGGNIYSTLNNGQYGMNSGTSMSAPHIAGMAALVLQYLRQEHPELTDSQLHTVAEALIMSTAVPVVEPSGVLYSPRKQGSGSANAYAAVSSPVYLTADNGDELTPKISFGDDDEKHGVYRFSFDVNNFSQEAHTYALDGTALTDQFITIQDIKFMGETSRQLDAAVSLSALGGGEFPTKYDANGDALVDIADVQYLLDGINGCHALTSQVTERFQTLALPADRLDTADAQLLYEMLLAEQQEQLEITVQPGETVTVYVTVALTDADKAYMDENYPNGIYVDGFVRLYAKSEGAVDLSLPFMGFYGDWSQAPVYDTGWYYETEDVLRFNRYPHVIFTESYNLGLNPYIINAPYDPAQNVLSPNGDNLNDVIDEIYIGMMRSAKNMTFTWSDADTGEVYYEISGQNIRKSYYYTQYGMNLPMMFTTEIGRPFDMKDSNGNVLANNTRLELTIDACLDDGNTEVDQSFVIPITVDTEGPTMDTESLRLWYEAATDSRKLEFRIKDNHLIAAVAVVTEAGGVLEILPVENEPGQYVSMELDVSNYDACFQIVLCDYGMNETRYEIEFAGQHNEDADAFYGYRHMSVIPSGNYYAVSEAYNGWYSFRDPAQQTAHTFAQLNNETEAIAAEYIDGYVIGVDENNKIFTMKMGDWNRTYLGDFKIQTGMLRYYQYQALDLAFDYTTNTLYSLTDEDGRPGYNKPPHLVTIDYLTGKVEDVGVVSFPDGSQGMTLACDNDGMLYTINYTTGELYTISKTPEKVNNINTVTATLIGPTGYVPQYWQAMTVDHETNKLYWAAYQGYLGDSVFYEVDKTTGELAEVSAMHQNANLSALFKPYHSGSALFPENEPVTALLLNRESIAMASGNTQKLLCSPLPYYADLGKVTWTSSDESIATVSGGIVTAVSAGTATITASYNDLSVTCAVTVKDFTGDITAYNTGSTSNNGWYHVDDLKHFSGSQFISDANEIYYFSAVNLGGKIYAYNEMSNFMLLDPETMEGTMLGERVTSNVITDLAMNYTDGYLYGLEFNNQESFWLVRVNRITGQTERVMSLSSHGLIYGMTIDREGYFYFLCMNPSSGKTVLKKALVYYDDWDEAYYLDVWNSVDLTSDYPMGNGLTSLYYSEANGGVFWTYYNELLFIELPTEGEASVISLGEVIPNDPYAIFMALHGTEENEPALPQVEVEEVSLQSSFRLLAGGSAAVNLDVRPWNCVPEVTYEVADTSIATVNEQGMITAISEGQTTLTVTVEGYDETLTSNIEVLPGGSTLYAYFITDFLYSGDWWISFNDYSPEVFTPITSYSYTVTAGDYYNGYIYAAAQAGNDYQNKIVFMKINPADYSYEVLAKAGCNIMDMAFDYSTGTMFAVADSGGNSNTLAQMDLATGELVEIADFGVRLVTLTATPEGQLYGIAADGCLYTVDKTTAELTDVSDLGSVSTSSYQSMTYDHNTGNVYWVTTSGALYLVDLETGSSTYVGNVGANEVGTMNLSCLFSVSEQVPQIPETVAPTGVSIRERDSVAVNQSKKLTASVLPLSQSQVDQTLNWTSSNESVATVDAEGNVTGVGAGVAEITATNVNGQSDTCIVTVTAETRYFYAYDRSNTQWIRFSGESSANVTVMRDDAEGESVILASAYTGEKLYSYDLEGRFYEVNPETFARTKISDGFYGQYQTHYDPDKGDYFDFYYKVADMSYDEATGKLYVSYELIAEYEYDVALSGRWCRCFATGISVVDPADGSFEEVFFQTYKRYNNLLVLDGVAYAVDTYISGMIDKIDLNSPMPTPSTFALVDDYWNLPGRVTGSSFIYDGYTGIVYTIRDLGDNGGESILYTMNLTDADVTPIGFIGGGIAANSLFIR